MYRAEEPGADGRVWRFRNLDALARRIAGNEGRYSIERSSCPTRPLHYSVRILVPAGARSDEWNVITRVLVPTDTLEKLDLVRRPQNEQPDVTRRH